MTNPNIFGQPVIFNESATFNRDIKISGDIDGNLLGKSIKLYDESLNRIFVSKGGDNSNSGRSPDDQVLTIDRAVEISYSDFSEDQVKSIYITSGDYIINNPIKLPKNCAIVGDTLRTVTLRPQNEDLDMFQVREGDLLTNLTFRDNESSNLTFRYAMAFSVDSPNQIVNRSPYALNCSLISTRGRGKNSYSKVAGQWVKGPEQSPRGSFAYVNGSVIDSISSGDTTGGNLESMVFALLSIITPGIGIHIDNCAYAQVVNVFGIFNTDNLLCENGGYCSVTNSATNFGINALRADGFSSIINTYSKDIGILSFSCASSVSVGSTNIINVNQTPTTIPSSQSIITIVDNLTGNVLDKPSINNLLRFGYDSEETNFIHSTTEFQIRKVSDAKTVTYLGTSRIAYDVAIYPRLDQHFSSPYTSYSSFTGKSVRQLRPSVVNSSGHTWEYSGSGTDYSALPKNGGFKIELNEQIEENYGQVYSSGTDELGDFKVGNFVRLKNQTGEVQFTTPIPIVTIDQISFSGGNTNLIIYGVQNDTALGGALTSDNLLATQRAINLFVTSSPVTFSNKTFNLSSNTLSGTTSQFNTALSDDNFVTISGSEALTNKTINGSLNTFSNIPNNALINSSISGVSLGSTLNTLTLNTSGTGLSGSTTYNGSSVSTFTVISNATSANTTSAIVARDGSGNFSAGTITASGIKLSGAFYDKDNSVGLSNQILSSTGLNTVKWINATEAAVGSATSISITSESANATRYLNFVSNTSGVDNVRIDTDLTYNPSTNTLTATNITATLTGTASALVTGSNYQVSSFGVGTAPSGTAGEIRATNNITAYYSDRRLKENIKVISSALSKILKLNGVTFNSNKLAEGYGYYDKKEQVGVIAQEVEAVLPQIVVPAPFDIGQDENGSEYSISGENYKTVQYEKLIPLLIEGIKEQQKTIEKLEKRIGYLESK